VEIVAWQILGAETQRLLGSATISSQAAARGPTHERVLDALQPLILATLRERVPQNHDLSRELPQFLQQYRLRFSGFFALL